MDLIKEKWFFVIFLNGDKKKILLCDFLDNCIQDFVYFWVDFQGVVW